MWKTSQRREQQPGVELSIFIGQVTHRLGSGGIYSSLLLWKGQDFQAWGCRSLAGKHWWLTSGTLMAPIGVCLTLEYFNGISRTWHLVNVKLILSSRPMASSVWSTEAIQSFLHLMKSQLNGKDSLCCCEEGEDRRRKGNDRMAENGSLSQLVDMGWNRFQGHGKMGKRACSYACSRFGGDWTTRWCCVAGCQFHWGQRPPFPLLHLWPLLLILTRLIDGTTATTCLC